MIWTNDIEMIDHYKNKRKALIITGIGTFMGTLDSSIVNVSLPTLGRELGASIDLVGWVALAYAITVFSLLLVFGSLAEKKGYQFSYTYGFALFMIGSILCGFSFNIYLLIFSRVFQGVGAAMMISVGPALVTRAFPPNERGRGLSIIVMMVAIGLMLGPPLGGFIVSYFGWSWIFFVNIPVSLAGIYYTRKYIADFPITDPNKQINLPAAISLMLSLIMMMLSLLLYSKSVLPNSVLAGLLVGGLISFGLFIYFEKNYSASLIGLDIFKNRIFVFSIAAMLAVFIGLISISILLPFYLEEIRGMTPDKVGLYLMTVPLCMFILSRPAGFLADRFPARIVSTTGVGILLIGMIVFMSMHDDTPKYLIIVGLASAGVGMALFGTPNTSTIMGSVDKERLGSVSGMIATVRTLGITLGAGFSIALFSYFRRIYPNGGADESLAFMYSYKTVYKIMIFFIITGMLLSAFRGGVAGEKSKEIHN